MSQRNLLILWVASLISYACFVRGEQDPYARYVASGLATIEERALDQVPSRELFHGAMRGMIDVLHQRGDDHSQFLAEDEAEPLRADIRQEFGGIGVRIQMLGDPPRLTIVGPPDAGTPAAQANLLPGDQILAIDGQPTADLTMIDVLRLMRGKVGEPIELQIRHEHQPEPRTVKLVRQIITIESILGDVRVNGAWEHRLPADRRIAHIRITSFGDKTAAELSHVLEELTVAGVEAVVLDERDNVGGALEAAVAVCGVLLPPGKLVVETRSRDSSLREQYMTRGEGRHTEIPVALLVNQNSASAAEIVAACLQDYGRAVVVGQRSYGKGTVQQLIPTESGRSLIKLTWASFWRPSGANIHRSRNDEEGGTWGVAPDEGLELTLTPEQYAAYRQYRNQRDMTGPAVATNASPIPDSQSTDPAGAAEPPTSHADLQLDVAVDYLQQLLDSNDGRRLHRPPAAPTKSDG